MSLPDDALQRIRQRVGTTVRGKYRLERLLGVGGMAAVFEAVHRNGSRVALKVLHPELARLADVRTRFLREGYVANRIAHPGVTRIIDDDDDDDGQTVFLVLELLTGETVEARSERFGGRLPLLEVVDHADRVLDVLAAAHEQGIVHRDVKPDNLFLTTQGELRILDFGIARLLDGTGATSAGELLGTPAFMSPEQANGRVKEIDGRNDLWSLGAVMYTLLTGAAVHHGVTPSEQLIYAATHQARPVESVVPWLPLDVAGVVNRALAFQREARWPDARAMQAALRATASFGTLRQSSSAPAAPLPAAGPPAGGAAPTAGRQPAIGTATIVQGSVGVEPAAAFELRRRPGPDGTP
jgi:serine/threonine protein kinase